MGFESFPYFPDGWTTNDLIYKWKENNPVQLTKNLSLPGGFKLANYSNHNCDVVTATGSSRTTYLVNSNLGCESSFPDSVASRPATRASKQTALAAAEDQQEISSLNLDLSLQACLLFTSLAVIPPLAAVRPSRTDGPRGILPILKEAMPINTSVQRLLEGP